MVKIIHFHMIILTKLIAVSNAARPLIVFVMSIYIYINTVVLRHLGMKGEGGRGIPHSNEQDFVFDDLIAPLATNKPLIIFFPPPHDDLTNEPLPGKFQPVSSRVIYYRF